MEPLCQNQFEEEDLDDPISLTNAENSTNVWSKTNVTGYTAAMQENTSENIEEEVIFIQQYKYELSNKSDTSTLATSSFDISRTDRLLKKCRPLSIPVVNCDKYPWFYKRFYKNRSLSLSSDDTIIIIDDCEDLDEHSKSDSCENDVIFLTSVDTTNVYSGNIPYLSNKIVIGQKKEVKDKGGREEQSPLESKLRQIDCKKNQGLVGLKIRMEAVTHKKATESELNNKQNKRDNLINDNNRTEEKLVSISANIHEEVSESYVVQSGITERGIPKRQVEKIINNDINNKTVIAEKLFKEDDGKIVKETALQVNEQNKVNKLLDAQKIEKEKVIMKADYVSSITVSDCNTMIYPDIDKLSQSTFIKKDICNKQHKTESIENKCTKVKEKNSKKEFNMQLIKPASEIFKDERAAMRDDIIQNMNILVNNKYKTKVEAINAAIQKLADQIKNAVIENDKKNKVIKEAELKRHKKNECNKETKSKQEPPVAGGSCTSIIPCTFYNEKKSTVNKVTAILESCKYTSTSPQEKTQTKTKENQNILLNRKCHDAFNAHSMIKAPDQQYNYTPVINQQTAGSQNTLIRELKETLLPEKINLRTIVKRDDMTTIEEKIISPIYTANIQPNYNSLDAQAQNTVKVSVINQKRDLENPQIRRQEVETFPTKQSFQFREKREISTNKGFDKQLDIESSNIQAQNIPKMLVIDQKFGHLQNTRIEKEKDESATIEIINQSKNKHMDTQVQNVPKMLVIDHNVQDLQNTEIRKEKEITSTINNQPNNKSLEAHAYNIANIIVRSETCDVGQNVQVSKKETEVLTVKNVPLISKKESYNYDSKQGTDKRVGVLQNPDNRRKTQLNSFMETNIQQRNDVMENQAQNIANTADQIRKKSNFEAERNWENLVPIPFLENKPTKYRPVDSYSSQISRPEAISKSRTRNTANVTASLHSFFPRTQNTTQNTVTSVNTSSNVYNTNLVNPNNMFIEPNFSHNNYNKTANAYPNTNTTMSVNQNATYNNIFQNTQKPMVGNPRNANTMPYQTNSYPTNKFSRHNVKSRRMNAPNTTVGQFPSQFLPHYKHGPVRQNMSNCYVPQHYNMFQTMPNKWQPCHVQATPIQNSSFVPMMNVNANQMLSHNNSMQDFNFGSDKIPRYYNPFSLPPPPPPPLPPSLLQRYQQNLRQIRKSRGASDTFVSTCTVAADEAMKNNKEYMLATLNSAIENGINAKKDMNLQTTQKTKPTPFLKTSEMIEMVYNKASGQKDYVGNSSAGYSPPILPIPTFQKTLETLCSDICEKKIKRVTFSINNILNSGTVPKTVETRQNKLKRKLQNDTVQEKNEEQYKKDEEKKRRISLDEYKKRGSTKDEKKLDFSAENNSCNTARSDNLKTRKYAKDSTDQDLGYDSDITAKP